MSGVFNEGFIGAGILMIFVASFLSTSPLKGVRRYLFFLTAGGSILLLLWAIYIIISHKTFEFILNPMDLLTFSFRADGLSGFFVFVISILTFSVSLYSVGYTKDIEDQGSFGAIFNLFIISMYGVVMAGNVITFLILWEAMSLLSYFLVVHKRDEASSRAGLVYAVMTHLGTAFIIALFLILYRYTGSMEFVRMKASVGQMPDAVKAIVFIFSMIGFGTKAGLVPLHIWLPEAHPAAPSNVSALMSGVMIKTGIYGILRVVFEILGEGPEWWGLVVLSIGAVSAVLGVMYALMEHDIKRLLAFHSVENIGIILLGLGASLIFKTHGLGGFASVALIAALYHTMNHAIFKALLFMGAGSVIHSIHTKNMEDMGGLLKKMPYTGLFFLVGSLAICAFPPFNGFVSEWLTYHALLHGYGVPSVITKLAAPLGGVALALTGALAGACFVKAFGISFLGMPRSEEASHAKESSPAMIAGMGMLALLCLFLGVFPFIVLRPLLSIILNLTGGAVDLPLQGITITTTSGAGISVAMIFLTLLVMGIAVWAFLRITWGRARITTGPSWDCGIPFLTPRMQYTATAFTKPVKMIFKRLYRPRRAISIEYTLKPLFVKSVVYHGDITPVFERFIYRPAIDLIHGIARGLRLIQSGSLHLYLAYILVAMILLLVLGR